MYKKEQENLSRRDFMKVSSRFGMTSTLMAMGALGTTATMSQVASAAEETQKKRYAMEPKFTLKFGAAGFNETNLDIQKSGQLFFARDLEERTNGAIRVEFIGSNQICGQTDCVKKTQQGIVDIYSASTQNSAGGAPYLKALSGPLPNYKFCPTGGVSLANASEYLALQNVLCVGGSWVAPKNLVEVGDWDAITKLASDAAALK